MAGIDKAFVDRAEELGIKDLLVAFAGSLVASRNAGEKHRLTSSEAGYVVTTLNNATCTCVKRIRHDKNGSRLLSLGSMPEEPHSDSCAWSRFMALFADDKTKAEFGLTGERFIAWAKAVDRKPDNEPYGAVVAAREFLQALKKKES